MYSTALERQTIPDTGTLSLAFLPDRARWSSPIEANKPNQTPIEATTIGDYLFTIFCSLAYGFKSRKLQT
jgi:hypothetical protein